MPPQICKRPMGPFGERWDFDPVAGRYCQVSDKFCVDHEVKQQKLKLVPVHIRIFLKLCIQPWGLGYMVMKPTLRKICTAPWRYCACTWTLFCTDQNLWGCQGIRCLLYEVNWLLDHWHFVHCCRDLLGRWTSPLMVLARLERNYVPMGNAL